VISIASYFSELSKNQAQQFEKLPSLYRFWNEQINVISRKDMENFNERHVLHSLGIAKVISFKKDTHVLDVGTGGGFPGIPLAILFPEVHFTLVDSIGKKIKVVKEISNELGLQNISAHHQRAEEVQGKYHFIVSRAVTQMPEFIDWVSSKIEKQSAHILKNGILYLKGGDLKEELSSVKQKHRIYSLSDYFEEPFFETKKVVHVELN
jgi:16S rRNA (guanine527-N7)-methyltransferase